MSDNGIVVIVPEIFQKMCEQPSVERPGEKEVTTGEFDHVAQRVPHHFVFWLGHDNDGQVHMGCVASDAVA
jgi:hypothetical protein